NLVLLFKLNIVEGFAVALGLLTVLGIWRFSALLHISTHYIGGFQGDAGLYSWLTNLNSQNFLFPWFETNGFYPYGYSLAWSDNFILPSLLASVLFKFGI